MSLGGRPPELYGQVRDGVADIVWTLAGYTPGVFPRVEVFELPTVHRGSAEATNQAIQELMDKYLAPDFAEVHPILIHVHSGQALHTVNRPVHTIDDVAGMKIRSPSRTGAWVIESWKAQPVTMPVPELPQALSKGVIDAGLIPFEVLMPLKVEELTRYSIEGHEGQRFGTSVFIYLMNKDRYESLPDDLKAVIDANSGSNIAAEVGRVWDSVEPKGKAVVEAHGNELIELTAEAQAAFDEAGEEVVQRWEREATSLGLPAEAMVEEARAAVAKYSK
jgi:TRAP-type C4-dicarboxylate transport system substrate-binding protein